MRKLFIILVVLMVAAGCDSKEDDSKKLALPLEESFEMYTRGIHPEGKRQRLHYVYKTTIKDSSISFRHFVDSNSVVPVSFIFLKDSMEINIRKYEESSCYTTTGPYHIQLSDTIITIYKIEMDCDNMVDEEGVQLYSPEIGFVGYNSYAWPNGTLLDSLYEHPLSSYAKEIRESILKRSKEFLE